MTATKTKHVHFIAKTSDGLYGHYGHGETEAEALSNLKATAGGELRKKRGTDDYRPKRGYALYVYRFESDLPFAPRKREARATEADAWIGQDGSVNWIRCEREQIREDINA